MARMSRAERQQEHRRKVEAHKARIREEMRSGGHIYGREWYREAVRSGDSAHAEALEALMSEIDRHNRTHPPDYPRRGVNDHFDYMRDLESRRREARDNERAAEIAEGARRKAAGIGGGLYATPAPEPEPEPEEEHDNPEAEEHEGRRRALMGHGLLSRTPAPPVQRKRRKKYTPPPFVG